MTHEQVEAWLYSKLNSQVEKAFDCLETVTNHLKEGNWKEASEAHRTVDYWLSRIKNTRRLIDELEDES